MASDLKALREQIMSRETITADDLVRIIDALESSAEETISQSRKYADGKVGALDERLKKIEPPKPTEARDREGEFEVYEP